MLENNLNQRTISFSRLYTMLTLVAIGLMFYFIDRGSPFCIDDFGYAYRVGTKSTVHINSFADAISSQLSRYELNRRIIHTLTQYFCGVLDNDGFRRINWVAFILLCIGIHKLAFPLQSLRPRNLCAIFLVCILPYAPMGSTFFANISNEVNYLWGGTAYIWFLYFYFKPKQRDYSRLTLFGIGFLSAICGTLQESFSLPILGMLIISSILRRNKSLTTVQIIMLIGFLAGVVIELSNPIYWSRASENSSVTGSFLYTRISNLLRLLRKVKALWIFIPAIIVTLSLKHIRIKKFLTNKNNAELCLVILLATLFDIVIVFTTEHQGTVIRLLLLVLLLRAINSSRVWNANYTPIALWVAIGLCFVPLYRLTNENFVAMQLLRQRIVTNPDREYVAAPEYEQFLDHAQKSMFGLYTTPLFFPKVSPPKPAFDMYQVVRHTTKSIENPRINHVVNFNYKQVVEYCTPENKIGNEAFLMETEPEQIVLRYPISTPTDSIFLQVEANSWIEGLPAPLQPLVPEYYKLQRIQHITPEKPFYHVFSDNKYRYIVYPLAELNRFGTYEISSVNIITHN